MSDVAITTFAMGPLETNGFVVTCGSDCWAVDPSIEPTAMLEYLREHDLSPSRIVLTHGHGDHIGGIDDVKQAYPAARVYCPAADAHMLTNAEANLSSHFGLPLTTHAADELIQPGDELTLGESQWQVLDTAGHTPGGVSLYCPDASICITGDALFNGSVGRVDLPGASGKRLIENIQANLMTLPDNTKVYPGHGPATTIGKERQWNPFLTGQNG